MSIDDECIDENDVKQYEMHAIKRRFTGLMDNLLTDATDEDEEDDDASDDDVELPDDDE